MEASSQRLSRLLNLVAALSETSQPLSARQLRSRLDADYGDNDDAFRRNFERDKAELRALGIEIDVVELDDVHPPETGYRIRRDQYALRLPDLDADEAAALELAVSLVRLDGLEGGTGLWKLGAARTTSDDPGIAALPAHPQLGRLFSAVAERRSATFTYRGDARHVDPYRLDFARGRWYLLAYDHDRAAERWFRLDRMDDLPTLGPAGGFAAAAADGERSVPDPWSLPDHDPVVARVLVDAGQAPFARSIVGDVAVVEERDDGGVVIELEVRHVAGFRSFVLGFLEHAEVLSPPELRASITEWLTALAGDQA